LIEGRKGVVGVDAAPACLTGGAHVPREVRAAHSACEGGDDGRFPYTTRTDQNDALTATDAHMSRTHHSQTVDPWFLTHHERVLAHPAADLMVGCDEQSATGLHELWFRDTADVGTACALPHRGQSTAGRRGDRLATERAVDRQSGNHCFPLLI